MLRSSRDIRRRLEREGWILDRVQGSHHVFRNPNNGTIVVLPHPRKDWGPAWFVHLSSGWMAARLGNAGMRHYIAIVEDAGNKTAVGVWFPDLPGCFAASDTIEEAMVNAPEAIGLYAEVLGHALPAPRSLVDLKGDPAFLDDLRDHMIALVALPEVMTAAE